MAVLRLRNQTLSIKRPNHLAIESLEARQLLACDTVPTLEIAKSEYVVGDVDCDGVFGTSDIVKVLLAGKFNGSADWSLDMIFSPSARAGACGARSAPGADAFIRPFASLVQRHGTERAGRGHLQGLAHRRGRRR